jgi:hypothetical protein
VETDYLGSGINGNGAIYNQLVSDGDATDSPIVGSVFGFGMLYDTTLQQTRVFLRGSNNDAASVILGGNPMIDVTVTKTNGGLPNARGDDPVVLQVYIGGVLQGSVASTLAGGLFTDTSEYAQFGNFNGAPRGSFTLSWATYGIGNGVEAPLPEPMGAATLVLVAASGMLLRIRRRTGTGR